MTENLYLIFLIINSNILCLQFVMISPLFCVQAADTFIIPMKLWYAKVKNAACFFLCLGEVILCFFYFSRRKGWIKLLLWVLGWMDTKFLQSYQVVSFEMPVKFVTIPFVQLFYVFKTQRCLIYPKPPLYARTTKYVKVL